MPPRSRGTAAAAAAATPRSAGKKKGGKSEGGGGWLRSDWLVGAAGAIVALVVAQALRAALPALSGGASRSPRRQPTEAFPVLVSRLKDWVTKHGGTVNPKVDAAERALGPSAAEGSDRGLAAAAAIEEGEVLVHVPEEALVRRKAVLSDPLAAEVYKALVDHRESCSSCSVRDPTCLKECRLLSMENNEEALGQIQLAVWIAKEKGAPSAEWQPWLDLLPADFGFSPAALPEPLLKVAFKDTAVLKEAQELQEAWQTAHEVLTRTSPLYAKHVPSYEAFRDARITVLSRVHGLPQTGDVIVPFVDLLNHDPEAPTWWGPSAKGGFELFATKPIAAGAAVTCSYGSERSSKELLMHYGFAPASNPFHSVDLDLGPDRKDPLYTAKRQALIEIDLYRSFSFSGRLGFAKSRPMQAPKGWDTLMVRDQDAYMFGQVLATLRVGALSVENLEGNDRMRTALLEQDESALAKLGASGAVLDGALEGRAARRLEEAAGAYLKQRGGEGSRDAAGVLAALRAAGVEGVWDSDLEQVAASAAALSATEARLFGTLRSAARAVVSLVEAGRWPEGAHGLAGTDAKPDEPARYVGLWARSFEDGLAALKPTSSK